MKFRVEITETLKRGVIVEAKDQDAALDLVRKHYDNGDIVLGADNFEDGDFVAYSEDEDTDPEYTESEEDDDESC